MSDTSFDTHEIVKDLKAAGFTDEQAEAVTRVVKNARTIDLRSLATKADLTALATKVDLVPFATKADLVPFATKADLVPFATKADLVPFATKTDLVPFATKVELAETKAEIIKWMVTTIGIQTIVIIGAVIALVRMGSHQ
jgi:hypothetical protein